MKLSRTILALLAISTVLPAAEKRIRVFTQEEAQVAYNLSTQMISRQLKAPATAQFTPFEEANFTPGGAGGRDDIVVRLAVDAQNSFGALLRRNWVCHVGPQRPDARYKVFCREGYWQGR